MSFRHLYLLVLPLLIAVTNIQSGTTFSVVSTNQGGISEPRVCEDLDGDGYCSDIDCNDSDADINPGATELCDGVDNNCDQAIDEGFDNDADDVSTCAGDCDDGDPLTYPEAPDLPGDGIDSNCDGIEGTDSDGDGVDDSLDNCLSTFNPSQLDADDDGTGNVCDPANTCVGEVVVLDPSYDVDRNIYCAAEASIETGSDNRVLPTGQFVVSAPAITLSQEFVVQDGGVLEAGPNQVAPCIQAEVYPDGDADSYGNPGAVNLLACPGEFPAGYVDNALDCNDSDPFINPDASELCDGIDNDCSNIADDNLSPPSCSLTSGVCNGAVQSCGGAGGWLACTSEDYGSNYEEIEFSCDGLDNDCDGETDEETNSSCDDGVFCNGAETCSTGACLTGTPPCQGVDDDVDCAESCNESSQDCTANDPTGSVCDDANACTTVDVCDGSGSCTGDVPLSCDDGNSCTNDACVNTGDNTHDCDHSNEPDGNICSIENDPSPSIPGTCQGGTCTASGGPCDFCCAISMCEFSAYCSSEPCQDDLCAAIYCAPP